jgi:hypothetical protein
MAKKDIENTLNEVAKKLHTRSAEYRLLVSDIQPHIFSTSIDRATEEVVSRLCSLMGIQGTPKIDKLPEYIQTTIKKEVPSFVAKMYTSLKRETSSRAMVEILFTPGSTNKDFTAIFNVTQKGKVKNLKAQKGEKNKKGKEVKAVNIFAAVKGRKKSAQKSLILALNKDLEKLNKQRNQNNQSEINPFGSGRGSSRFIDLGHEEGYGVNEQRRIMVDDALFSLDAKATGKTKQFLQTMARDYGFTIQKTVKGGREVVAVGLEAADANSSTALKKEQQNINKDLQAILTEMDIWGLDEGSDSYVSRVDKTVRKAFFTHLTGKNVKVTKTSTKIVLPFQGKISASVGASVRNAVTSKKEKQKRSRGAGINQKTPSNSAQPLMLMALINQQLPQTVRKNMREPGLVNRTGTFADSVRMSDVMTTPQGFPSFGYTYQKDPYQVFEQGSGDPRWSTQQRDPRTVINKSIREIAAQYAVGRFFTRRT